MGDLSAPILQPWAREQMRQRNERVLAGKPAFSRQASCWPVGTPDFCCMRCNRSISSVAQGGGDDLAGRSSGPPRLYELPHSPNPKPSWFRRIGCHYEGDMLVVDTIASDTRTFIDQLKRRTPKSSIPSSAFT